MLEYRREVLPLEAVPEVANKLSQEGWSIVPGGLFPIMVPRSPLAGAPMDAGVYVLFQRERPAAVNGTPVGIQFRDQPQR